jgi:hypothetical protein
MELKLHAFLDLGSALDGGKWSASRPGRFIPRERAPGTHWIGGRAGPITGLDVVVKRKINLTNVLLKLSKYKFVEAAPKRPQFEFYNSVLSCYIFVTCYRVQAMQIRQCKRRGRL